MKQEFKVAMVFDEDNGTELETVEMVLPYIPRKGDLYFKSKEERYEIRGVAFWGPSNTVMVMALKFKPYSPFNLFNWNK